MIVLAFMSRAVMSLDLENQAAFSITADYHFLAAWRAAALYGTDSKLGLLLILKYPQRIQ